MKAQVKKLGLSGFTNDGSRRDLPGNSDPSLYLRRPWRIVTNVGELGERFVGSGDLMDVTGMKCKPSSFIPYLAANMHFSIMRYAADHFSKSNDSGIVRDIILRKTDTSKRIMMSHDPIKPPVPSGKISNLLASSYSHSDSIRNDWRPPSKTDDARVGILL